ncbi:MAG: hypothetical protein ACRCWI_03710 [Brevinema sp.]
MKKNILLFFLLHSCTISDSTKIWLQTIRGSWQTTPSTKIWFSSLNPTVDVPSNTSVEIIHDGSFIISGIHFQFFQVEGTGSLAIYSFIHPSNTPPRYIGLGLNIQNDILFNPTISSSPDQVRPTPKGSTFLMK